MTTSARDEVSDSTSNGIDHGRRNHFISVPRSQPTRHAIVRRQARGDRDNLKNNASACSARLSQHAYPIGHGAEVSTTPTATLAVSSLAAISRQDEISPRRSCSLLRSAPPETPPLRGKLCPFATGASWRPGACVPVVVTWTATAPAADTRSFWFSSATTVLFKIRLYTRARTTLQ